MEFLPVKFVEEYVREHDWPLTELGEFVYYRTYSRWLEGKGRREYWHETVKRAIEYNMALEYKHLKTIGLKPDLRRMRDEAKELFINIYEAKQFPSGRTLWLGNGNETINKDFALGNFNCFTEDTEFITNEGVKSFEDFDDGEEVKVLNKNGKFVPATVANFGQDTIYELTVRRGRREEVIQTTGNHRWYAKNTPSYSSFDVRTTEELSVGAVLRTKKTYEHANIVPSTIGITHGIVFGDGTYDKRKNHTRVSLIGDKQELSKYIVDGNTSTEGDRDSTLHYGLPKNFKELPSITMNIEYLYGFLLGLFATDGSVSNNQHSISNSNKDVLKAVKDIAILCGINSSEITINRELSPFDGSYAPSYRINFNSEDIKPGFHLRTKHKNNFNGDSDKKLYWKVVDVVKTERYEDVWCVIEEETESFTLANGILTKNCAFLNIDEWKDLTDVFYTLMVGTGTGFKSTKEKAKNMAKIRTNVTVIHADYEPVPVDKRLEDTKLSILDNGYAKIYVGDSKNGWVDSLGTFLRLLTEEEYEQIHTIKLSYNSVRPKGERLKTFGGTASGHEPLREMFEGIDKVLKNEIDPHLEPIETDEKGYGHVRPIHVLDIGNLIGANVVVGGVRRTAEIFLFDADDYESMFAKYGINGIWTEDQLAQHKKVGSMLDELGIKPKWFDDLSHIGARREGLDHRRMSNNSIAFTRKPADDFMRLVFEMMQMEGEPGFVNLESAARRVAESLGVENPTDSYIQNTAKELGLNPLT